MEIEKYIKNYDSVISAMGHWPHFHDSVVMAIEKNVDSCTVDIHVFDMTNQVDENGYYVLRNHHRIVMMMTGVIENTLYDEDQKDILFDLEIEKVDDRFTVIFDSVMGLGGVVKCHAIKVVQVLPCDKAGNLGA